MSGCVLGHPNPSGKPRDKAARKPPQSWKQKDMPMCVMKKNAALRGPWNPLQELQGCFYRKLPAVSLKWIESSIDFNMFQCFWHEHVVSLRYILRNVWSCHVINSSWCCWFLQTTSNKQMRWNIWKHCKIVCLWLVHGQGHGRSH